MSITLYDATVARFLQTLQSTENILQKGAQWCEETGTDPDALVDDRLRDDMLPLSFQVNSISHHSRGAIEGVKAGKFAPPPSLELDYAGMQELVRDTRSTLEGYERDEIEALADRELTFATQRFSVDFVGQDFLLSFSVPNFFFHVTTAYAILRKNGVALGKLDYLGRFVTKE